MSKVYAQKFLEEGTAALAQRAEQRDSEKGERSMKATVKAFNKVTGHKLSESDGWTFMILLKIVRGRKGKFHKDDYIDMASYAGLLGECESSNA